MAWDWIRANATALSLVVVVISGIISGIVGTVWYFGQLVGRLTAVTTVDAVERKVDALSEQVSTLVTTTTVDEVERKVDALSEQVSTLVTTTTTTVDEVDALSEQVSTLVTPATVVDADKVDALRERLDIIQEIIPRMMLCIFQMQLAGLQQSEPLPEGMQDGCETVLKQMRDLAPLSPP